MWKKSLMNRLLLFLLGFLFVVFSGASGQGQRKKQIVIEPPSASLFIGDTLRFEARLRDKQGGQKDTTITWSVDAAGFGEIAEDGLFTALNKGRGFVYASAGELVGRAHVTVVDSCDCDSSQMEWRYLEILPEDSLVLIGQTVQYSVYLVDTAGIRHDTTADDWNLRGNQVGTITEQGFFTALDEGIGIIQATVGRKTAVTKVIVSTMQDTADADSIQIKFRDRDGTQYGMIRRIQENEVFLIHGLPYPFNLINGGQIVFPPGSLEQGISIEITLPDIAELRGDSTVVFPEQILNGISFHVTVDGELVSPFFFEEPVQLILPFKEDLLNTLGLVPEDLWIFFYSDSAGYDDNGITDVVVDTVRNKIYANIIHFSDLVVTSSDYSEPTGIENDRPNPDHYHILTNYPNPFNPETIIQFDLRSEIPQEVSVTIYNLRGQKVRTLFNGTCEPGLHFIAWDGTDETGNLVESGVFFYRLKSRNISVGRRMILLK